MVETHKPINVTKSFRTFSFSVLLCPYFFLILFVIDMFTIGFTEALFWALFLFSLLPCSVLGFIFINISLKSRATNLEKEGIIRMVSGTITVFGIIAGLIGWGLLYIVTY
jgi:hypothetical protein